MEKSDIFHLRYHIACFLNLVDFIVFTDDKTRFLNKSPSSCLFEVAGVVGLFVMILRTLFSTVLMTRHASLQYGSKGRSTLRYGHE
jgi:hypothetical protein